MFDAFSFVSVTCTPTSSETQEHAGVHAHRTGGIEQDNEPQRLFLALPLDEVDRDAAMADIAVNGPAQIEPVAAPPRQIAPRQPRAHRARQPRGRFMRLLDLRGIGQPAEIHLGQIVGTRGPFHAAFAGVIDAAIVGGWNLIHRRLATGALAVSQSLERRIVRSLRRARCHRSRPHALAEPERVKDAVEFFPVGFARREQVLERRTQQTRFGRVAGRHQFRRILAFGEAYGEPAVAQGLEKRGEP